MPGIDRIRDVPARTIDVPREPRPWDLSATALEETLAAGDWHATVAFKTSSGDRIAANAAGRGVRGAVTKEDAEAGLILLESRGVRIAAYESCRTTLSSVVPT